MTSAIASPWRPRVVLLCALVVCALLSGCDAFEGEPILQWTDSESGTQITVRSNLHGGKNRVHMEVEREGETQRMVLVDDANIHLASLLRYNDWLLVLSGDYVLGGYDLGSGKIAPVNSRALPFTVRTRSGRVVHENRLSDGEDTPPFNFEPRRDPLD